MPSNENEKAKEKAENGEKNIPEAPELLIHLAAVGDIMLSRNVGRKMVKHKDYQYPFLATKDFLQ
ncbi:MAG: hypothetical protein Q8N68_02830, partial [bacterium]|nr:hypothetical protein [bacterium]